MSMFKESKRIYTMNISKDITIDPQTINANATSGSDYMGSHGSVTIKAGETSTYYNVMIFKDNDYQEGNKSFYLAPTGYMVEDNFERKAA